VANRPSVAAAEEGRLHAFDVAGRQRWLCGHGLFGELGPLDDRQVLAGRRRVEADRVLFAAGRVVVAGRLGLGRARGGGVVVSDWWWGALGVVVSGWWWGALGVVVSGWWWGALGVVVPDQRWDAIGVVVQAQRPALEGAAVLSAQLAGVASFEAPAAVPFMSAAESVARR
jgi:hypothetical protein